MEEKDIVYDIPERTRRVGVVTSGSIDEINIPGYTEEEVKSLPSLNFVWYRKL